MSIRELQRVINAQPSSDGDGVKILRIAGRELSVQMDPFLLLDEIRSEDGADYIGGFPPHPHRGFETITYMLEGAMRHRDHMGNEGVIGRGDVQWMTAGRGVIHSEMPEQSDGLLHGFQLWLNLPAAEKMQPAAYQEFKHADIPVFAPGDGVRIAVIAGQIAVDGNTVTGPVSDRSTHPIYLDVELSAGASVTLPVKAEQIVMARVFDGATRQLASGQMGLYANGDAVTLEASAEGARLLLLMATPLNEPIAQHGPFVMNTFEEIEQAMRDYTEDRLTD